LGLAIAGLTIEVLGLVASSAFESALHIDHDFAAGPVECFSEGVLALGPFVVLWVVAFGFLGMVAGLRPLYRAPLEAIRRRWNALTSSADGESLAASVLLAGVGCWIAITWACRSLFVVLDDLRIAFDKPLDLSVLSSGAASLHIAHGNYSAGLSFLLVLAVWKWFPRLERRTADPSRMRILTWATVFVAFMVVATAVVPRRFLWDRFEVVQYEKQRAFIIGARSDELLVYSPYGGERKRWRVPRNAATLQRSGTTARLFDSK
jgi:hypothetical protein